MGTSDAAGGNAGKGRRHRKWVILVHVEEKVSCRLEVSRPWGAEYEGGYGYRCTHCCFVVATALLGHGSQSAGPPVRVGKPSAIRRDLVSISLHSFIHADEFFFVFSAS